MVGCLGAEFHLPQTLVGVSCRLCDRVPEKIGGHEMRTGAGRKKSSVTDKTKSSLIDLTVAPYGCLDGISRLGEGRGIQDHDIIFFPFSVEGGEQVEDVRTLIAEPCAGFIDEYAFSGSVQQFIGGENLPAIRVALHPGGEVYVSPEHIILHPGFGSDNAENRIPYSPAHTLFAALGYHWSKVSLQAHMRGIGPIAWNEENALVEPFYVTLGARASVSIGRVLLYLEGENLTNTRYKAFYFNVEIIC